MDWPEEVSGQCLQQVLVVAAPASASASALASAAAAATRPALLNWAPPKPDCALGHQRVARAPFLLVLARAEPAQRGPAVGQTYARVLVVVVVAVAVNVLPLRCGSRAHWLGGGGALKEGGE